MKRKRLLILGCSHSVGEYVWDSKAERANTNDTSGWPMRICERYSNYDVWIVSWPGGGLINYIWFLGYIIRYYGKDFFDKIIMQLSHEPRLTLYGFRFAQLFDKRWDTIDKSKFFLLYSLRTICYPSTKEVIFNSRENFTLEHLSIHDITELSDINDLSKCYHFVADEPLEIHMDNTLPPADQVPPSIIEEAEIYNNELHNNATGAGMTNLGYFYSTIDNTLDLILSIFDQKQLFVFAYGEFNIRWYRVNTNFKSAYNISDKELHAIEEKTNGQELVDNLIEHVQSRGFYAPNGTVRDYIISTVGKKKELLLQMPDRSSHYGAKGNNMVYEFLQRDNLLNKFMNNE